MAGQLSKPGQNNHFKQLNSLSPKKKKQKTLLDKNAYFESILINSPGPVDTKPSLFSQASVFCIFIAIE